MSGWNQQKLHNITSILNVQDHQYRTEVKLQSRFLFLCQILLQKNQDWKQWQIVAVVATTIVEPMWLQKHLCKLKPFIQGQQTDLVPKLSFFIKGSKILISRFGEHDILGSEIQIRLFYLAYAYEVMLYF